MNTFDNSRRWRDFIAATQAGRAASSSYPSVLEALRRSREWFSEAAEDVRIRCSARPVETPPA